MRIFEPEAIGGEMEGAGLYVACQDSKVDWILVKAICDWADGCKDQRKEKRQQLAAQNSARMVVHMLQQAPLKTAEVRGIFPARSSTINRACHSSLPRQHYFFGRQKELAIIVDSLLPDSRSWGVLIDGPGGIGKTALAIRAGYLAPAENFPLKIFLSAKVRELTPSGEEALQDYMLPNFMALLSELASELGKDSLAKIDPNERANALRRALANKHTLIIIDNVETFTEPERIRLYQFLSRLPDTCKAIVTSRRRTDIDARVIRLDRLAPKDAMDLIAELAKSNRYLHRASEIERQALYEITNGNPLLIKWVVGQLGRSSGHCRTISEACEFLKSAPQKNDPLEYIFGDLLDTFTDSETAVLAGLAHFTQPAKVEWITELAGLSNLAAQTALEDLADRALLDSNEEAQEFFLPTLATTFLRKKRPEAMIQTGERLTDRVYALIMENGGQAFERFPILEAEWPTIAAALPLLLQGDNERLQEVCRALEKFLDFYGRWDERLSFDREAEVKALAAGDLFHAGWRAYKAGWIYYLRGKADDVRACADRSEDHWQNQKDGMATPEKAAVIGLRGLGFSLDKNFPAAIESFQEALRLERIRAPEGDEVVRALIDLADTQTQCGDYFAAESVLSG